jgi:hypothetical protein
VVGVRWVFGLVAVVALVLAATAPRIIPRRCPPTAALRLGDVREP